MNQPLPMDFDDLLYFLGKFIEAESRDAQMRVVRDNPELISPAVVNKLQNLAQQFSSEGKDNSAKYLEDFAYVILNCRY